MSPLLLLLSLFAHGAEVHVDGARWERLRPPEAPSPEQAPGPRVTRRDVVLRPSADGLHLHVTWQVDTDRRGWLSGRLIGPGPHVEKLDLDGLGAYDHPTGTQLSTWLDGPATLTLDAVIEDWSPGEPIALSLLPAATGTVRLEGAPNRRLELVSASAAHGEQGWWAVDGALQVTVRRAERPEQRTLTTATAGLGLTVGDDAVLAQARLRWEVRRGALDEVAFTAAGAGADLDVTGPQVRSWRREGERVVVTLRERARSAVELEASWTLALPDADEQRLPLPQVLPEAFKVERTLQLATDTDREVVPLLPDWQPTANRQLPRVGQGLITGTPSAAFVVSGSAGGALSLQRFVPVPGPAAVVDIAQYTVATSAEGRALVRVLYEVRNERAPWLEVTPPPGFTLLGARVGSETATPARGEHGAWRLPLLRSVETVEGLLTFPVEVALLGEESAWDGRERRTLTFPTVDAEVAVNRVTLLLPPGYRSRLDIGESGRVADFSAGEELVYGFGVGDTDVAQADALFQEAVSAWLDNDFDQAQVSLDALRQLGGETENVRRLQSNLDLLDGDYQGQADETVSRRIRDQARARSLEDQRRADALQAKADAAQDAGNYDDA